MTTIAAARLTHLQRLEAESIHIMRETVGEAENPVMLRLKELEALSEIAGKVERLTIHNGTAGLMNDLVKLRDE